MREPPKSPPTEKNRAAAELGRKGGLKGGATRAARMTPEERSASARQAAAARWARAASESSNDNAPAKTKQRAKPFVFKLDPSEALWITEAKGVGGQQSLHRRLVAQLAKGDLTITLNDAQLGELIRYMTQYGSGGFQDRLFRAFSRSIYGLLAIEKTF